MQLISSRGIFYYKVIFPIFWFGILGFMVVLILTTSNRGNRLPLITFLLPLFMAVFGYFSIKRTVWDLADQVFDAGDSLIFRFGKEEDRIPLSNIIDVRYISVASPPRVILTLRTPANFGNKVSFAAPAAPTIFLPIARNSLIVNLIQRVDMTREEESR